MDFASQVISSFPGEEPGYPFARPHKEAFAEADSLATSCCRFAGGSVSGFSPSLKPWEGFSFQWPVHACQGFVCSHAVMLSSVHWHMAGGRAHCNLWQRRMRDRSEAPKAPATTRRPSPFAEIL